MKEENLLIISRLKCEREKFLSNPSFPKNSKNTRNSSPHTKGIHPSNPRLIIRSSISTVQTSIRCDRKVYIVISC